MDKDKGKPVDLVCIAPFKHDGRHFAVGEVLQGCEAELAKELTGAGRTRLAKAEDLAPKAPAAKRATRATRTAQTGPEAGGEVDGGGEGAETDPAAT